MMTPLGALSAFLVNGGGLGAGAALLVSASAVSLDQRAAANNASAAFVFIVSVISTAKVAVDASEFAIFTLPRLSHRIREELVKHRHSRGEAKLLLSSDDESDTANGNSMTLSLLDAGDVEEQMGAVDIPSTSLVHHEPVRVLDAKKETSPSNKDTGIDDDLL
jgi:hypothetical protein